MDRVLVVMPCYNERENLGRIIPEVLEVVGGVDLLIIDDGSPDGSGAVAQEWADRETRVRVIHREGKQGLGTAYIVGFRQALEDGYDAVIQMDADLSHTPAVIPWLLANLPEGGIVVGSRYLGGIRILNWPLVRLFLSVAARWYVRLITGMPLSDPTSGYTCIDRSALAAVDLGRLHSNGYSFLTELKYVLWRHGCPMREFPIVFCDRTDGRSKMSGAIIIEALWRTWLLRLRWRQGGGRYGSVEPAAWVPRRTQTVFDPPQPPVGIEKSAG